MIKLSEESVFYLPKELVVFFRVPFFHSVVNLGSQAPKRNWFCFVHYWHFCQRLLCAIYINMRLSRCAPPSEARVIIGTAFRPRQEVPDHFPHFCDFLAVRAVGYYVWPFRAPPGTTRAKSRLRRKTSQRILVLLPSSN